MVLSCFEVCSTNLGYRREMWCIQNSFGVPLADSVAMFPSLRPQTVDRQQDLRRLQKMVQDSPRERPATTSHSTRKTVIVVETKTNEVPCPECGQLFKIADSTELKTHVFNCRIEHGTDPLLPLQMLVPSKEKTRPNRDLLLRAIEAPKEKITIFTGREAPKSLDSPRHRIVGNAELFHRTASSSRSRPSPAVTRSTKSSRGWRKVFNEAPKDLAPSYRSGEKWTRTQGTGSDEPIRFDDEPRTSDAEKLCNIIENFTQLPHELAETSPLDLADINLGEKEMVILEMALGRGSWIAPRVLDTSRCSFQESALSGMINVLLSCSTLEEVITKGNILEPMLSRIFPTHNLSVDEHVSRNRKVAAARRAERQFSALVASYQESRANSVRASKEFYNTLRENRGAIREAEKRDRERLYAVFTRIAREEEALRFKQEVRELKRVQRLALCERESEFRMALLSLWVNGLVAILAKQETDSRRILLQKRETSRLQDRLIERDAIASAKAAERLRLSEERQRRHLVESAETSTREEIVQQWESGLQIYYRQSQRHSAFVTWKQQQREDVEGRNRYETTVREGIEKEEESTRNSLLDKLRRSLESVRTKYAAQVEMLCYLETSKRSVEEEAMNTWYHLSLRLFNTEAKLIRLYRKACEQEARRTSLLEESPLLSLNNGEEEHPLLFTMPAIGQQVAFGVPFLQHCRLNVEMRQGWLDELQATEDSCRQAVIEEKAAVHDHIRSSQRYQRQIEEASTQVFADFDPVDLSTVLAVSKPDQVPQLQDSKATTPTPPNRSVKQETGRTTRNRRASLVTPSSPGIDLAIAEAANSWNLAWQDKLSVAEIHTSKLAIRGGIVKCTLLPAEADDIGTGGDRLSCKSQFPTEYDDGKTETETDLHPVASFIDDFFMSFDTSGTFNSKPRRRSSTTDQSQSEADQAVHDSTSDSKDNRSASETNSDSEETEENDEEEKPEEPERLALSTIALDLGSPDQYAILQKPIVDTTLEQLKYQNIAQVTPLTKHQPARRQITVSIALCFERSRAYGDTASMQDYDLNGWKARTPAPEQCIFVVKIEKTIDIVLVPSVFILPGNSPYPETTVLIEGQMNEVQLFPGVERIKEPFRCRWSDEGGERNLVIEQPETPHAANDSFTGGTMQIEVLGVASHWDRISLRDEAPIVKCETLERSTFVKSAAVFGEPIVTVFEGELQAARMITSKNGSTQKAFCSLRIGNTEGKVVAAEALRHVINRLRYHNFQQEPEEGERLVRLTLWTADRRFFSTLQMRYEVEPIDKPTELKIVHPRILHRWPVLSIPAALRQYVAPTLIPVAADCLVVDEDTDRFSGGHLKVTLCGALKGDFLAFAPNSHDIYPVELVMERPLALSMGGDDVSIIYEERVVARITHGYVLTDPTDGEEIDTDEFQSITMDFAQEDDCSIKAVQAILRHIVVRPASGVNPKQHAAAARQVDFFIQIMDNEQACQIEDVVVIRGGGHAVQLNEKSTTVDYKEGAGTVRIANFDISSDRINPINNFSGGYALIHVAEGFDSDNISLKTDETEYKLVEVGEKPSRIARMAGKSFGAEVKPELPQTASIRGSASRASIVNLKDRFRSAAMEVTKHPETNSGKFAGAAKEALRQNKTLEIVFAGMREPMASVTRLGSGRGVFIKFYNEKKDNFVTRKHVTTLLRNLTYTCTSSSPDETHKILRLWVSDSGSATPSQCVLSLNIEVVDDVTEILVKSPRKAFHQGPDVPSFALLPAGRARLADEDTEYFDGGCLTLALVAGSPKGDVLGIRPPNQQKQNPQKPALAGFSPLTVSSIEVRDDGKTIWANDRQVATVDIVTQNAGHSELKVNFLPAPKPGEEVVTIDMATTIMNSICFGNILDRVKDTKRAYMVRIRDVANPVEGKVKIQLDIHPPVAVLSPCIPFGTAMSFENQFIQDTWLPPNSPGLTAGDPETMPVAKQLTINSEKISIGSVSVKLAAESGDALRSSDQLDPRWKDSGIIAKDGNLMMGKDHLASEVVVSPTSIAFAFNASHKMNKATLQSILRNITLIPDRSRPVAVSNESQMRATPSRSPMVGESFRRRSETVGGRSPNAEPLNRAASVAGHVIWTISDGSDEVELISRLVYT